MTDISEKEPDFKIIKVDDSAWGPFHYDIDGGFAGRPCSPLWESIQCRSCLNWVEYGIIWSINNWLSMQKLLFPKPASKLHKIKGKKIRNASCWLLDGGYMWDNCYLSAA